MGMCKPLLSTKVAPGRMKITTEGNLQSEKQNNIYQIYWTKHLEILLFWIKHLINTLNRSNKVIVTTHCR